MGGRLSKNHHSFNHGPSIPGSSPYYSGNRVKPDASRFQRRYTRIDDNYNSLEEVTAALAQAGLESSNLIVGVDFTKSNEWTGARSFNHRSLHHIGGGPNPYEQAISIIGRTLSAFDEDNLIPCYGFGDATTHDKEVFSFYPDDRPCNGFEDALSRYRELVPKLHLAGPTSFAPIIETAVGIVENSGGQYHVLLIIADGQVTRSAGMDPSKFSSQERDTIKAIVEASDYPLSIVLVGVGDGPWDTVHQFDDNIPARAFDNLQFVNFTEIMSKRNPSFKKETEFALAALMEIPSQYKAILGLQLLSCRRGTLGRIPLPPPTSSNYSRQSSFEQGTRYHESPSTPASNYPPQNTKICCVCLWRSKDLAFGCGHQTCYECGIDLLTCPTCRSYVTTKIRLF